MSSRICSNCHLMISAASNIQAQAENKDNTRRTGVLVETVEKSSKLRDNKLNCSGCSPLFIMLFHLQKKSGYLLGFLNTLKKGIPFRGFNREALSFSLSFSGGRTKERQRDIKQTHLLPGPIPPALPSSAFLRHILTHTHGHTHTNTDSSLHTLQNRVVRD